MEDNSQEIAQIRSRVLDLRHTLITEIEGILARLNKMQPPGKLIRMKPRSREYYKHYRREANH